MNAYEIELIIRNDISVDIYGDLYGVERAAEYIASQFAVLEAGNARLRELLEQYANYRDSLQVTRD